MVKKDYIINILLLTFSLLLLLTLKTTIFNTVSYYLFVLDFKEQALYVTDFYVKYLFNNTNLNHGCVICDELTYRFPFDNILFKFALLNIITLLLIKYRKLQWTLTSEDIFFIPLILCFFVYICYVSTFNNNMSNIFYFNYTNIVQYIIFITYILSTFVYYPLIILLLWKDNKLTFELKIFYLILITYFIVFFKADCFVFLYTSGNSLDVNPGINYILHVYNFPVMECMNDSDAQPKDQNFCAYRKYMKDHTCSLVKTATTNPTIDDIMLKNNCDKFIEEFRRYCGSFYAESKK